MLLLEAVYSAQREITCEIHKSPPEKGGAYGTKGRKG